MVEKSYLEFVPAGGKKNAWNVLNKSAQITLGRISWYPSWKQFCFFPITGTELVFSAGCLLEIVEFMRVNKLKTRG